MLFSSGKSEIAVMNVSTETTRPAFKNSSRTTIYSILISPDFHERPMTSYVKEM